MLEKLRSATAVAHQRLEKVAGGPAIASGKFTRDEYIHFLLTALHFHSAVEQLFSPELHQEIPELERRKKSASILKDLQLLGAPTLRPKEVLFGSRTFAEVTGLLYVSEGSMLGGKVIYKQLQKNSEIRAYNAFHFLNLYKHDLSHKWKSFTRYLNEYPWSPQQEGEMIKAAIDGFQTYEQLHLISDVDRTRNPPA